MTTNLHQFAEFSDKNIFVGIDVHKKSWTISLYYEQNYLRTFTQPPSVVALEKTLKREYPGANYVCGYEASYSGFWIQRQLSEKGITCKVLHPADIPQTGKRKTIKRDTTDASGIAQALATAMVDSIYIPNVEDENDRGLVRHRVRLLQDINRCKNRIRGILLQYGFEVPEQFSNSWSNKFVQWLTQFEQAQGSLRLVLNHMINQMVLLREELLKVNKDIRTLQKSEKYKTDMDLLTSIPGIGPLSAITILTEIIDINRFKSFRCLNSFVGFYPMEFSSGENEHKGPITLRKNCFLRSIIIEAAWVAVRNDPALTQVFQQLKLRMTAKRAIIKIARKLLNRIRFVWMNKQSYVKGLVK
jgi:transposase